MVVLKCADMSGLVEGSMSLASYRQFLRVWYLEDGLSFSKLEVHQ